MNDNFGHRSPFRRFGEDDLRRLSDSRRHIVTRLADYYKEEGEISCEEKREEEEREVLAHKVERLESENTKLRKKVADFEDEIKNLRSGDGREETKSDDGRSSEISSTMGTDRKGECHQQEPLE
jgi:chromosome segregation ATPase